MGQTSSLLLCSASPRHRDDATPLRSLFLQLPVDIILLLCWEYLPPESALALSLTCKSLFGLVSGNAKMRLGDSGREAILLLLEKDAGYDRYYCHTCSVLHRFSSSAGPALRDFTWKFDKNDCRRHDLLYLMGSSLTISYHHVRLVMNRHFLGPPNGLPLDRFQLENTSFGSLRRKEKWSARILEDELFLSAARTLCWSHGADEALRNAVDDNWYAICGHVDMAKFARLSISAPHPTTSLVAPCRDVVESCNKCLTDYDTTVERRWIKDGRRKKTRACWFITVTSYHRLGGGRSPLDVKWHAFAARGFWDLYTTSRDMTRYPRSAVREMWKDGESQTVLN